MSPQSPSGAFTLTCTWEACIRAPSSGTKQHCTHFPKLETGKIKQEGLYKAQAQV